MTSIYIISLFLKEINKKIRTPSAPNQAVRLIRDTFKINLQIQKRKLGGLKSSPFGIFRFFRLKEINKSKRRSLGCRLRLNEQERAQK